MIDIQLNHYVWCVVFLQQRVCIWSGLHESNRIVFKRCANDSCNFYSYVPFSWQFFMTLLPNFKTVSKSDIHKMKTIIVFNIKKNLERNQNTCYLSEFHNQSKFKIFENKKTPCSARVVQLAVLSFHTPRVSAASSHLGKTWRIDHRNRARSHMSTLESFSRRAVRFQII